MATWTWKAGLAGAVIIAATVYAVAQMSPGHGTHSMMGPGNDRTGPSAMNGPMPGQTHMHGPMAPGGNAVGPQAMMHDQVGPRATMGQPRSPGQDAFGAIQEVVQILQNDPSTEWSKVNIAALRQHLIDMNEVTLYAAAKEQPIENGVEIMVTGHGRTAEAIKRMVPTHARELMALGWNAKTEDLPDGVKLTVTGANSNDAVKLKALGFMGIMVQGGHHQLHHLAMAKG